MRPIQSFESVTLVEGSSLLVDFSFGEDGAAMTNCCKLLTGLIHHMYLAEICWLKSTLKNFFFFTKTSALFEGSSLGENECGSSSRCTCDLRSVWGTCAVPTGEPSSRLASTSVLWITCCLKSTPQRWRCCTAKLLRAPWRRSSRWSEKILARKWVTVCWVISQKIKLCCPFVAWQNKIFTMCKIVYLSSHNY